MKNKRVKQMICDQLKGMDNGIIIRAWFEGGKLVAWFNCGSYKTKAFLVHGCEVSLTASKLKGNKQ